MPPESPQNAEKWVSTRKPTSSHRKQKVRPLTSPSQTLNLSPHLVTPLLPHLPIPSRTLPLRLNQNALLDKPTSQPLHESAHNRLDDSRSYEIFDAPMMLYKPSLTFRPTFGKSISLVTINSSNIILFRKLITYILAECGLFSRPIIFPTTATWIICLVVGTGGPCF